MDPYLPLIPSVTGRGVIPTLISIKTAKKIVQAKDRVSRMLFETYFLDLEHRYPPEN